MSPSPRPLLLAALFGAPMFAFAALPIGETALRVNVVDAQTGKAVGGTIIAASESYYWSGFHSSGTTCFRAISRTLDSQNTADSLRLPAVDIITSTKVVGDTRHIQLFIYRPGYCGSSPYASASTAGFLKWANKNDPNGLWGFTASLKPADTATIRMAPASDPPEHRLRHLVAISRAISAMCPDLPDAFREAMVPALVKEANELASTPVERVLAAHVGEALLHSTQRKSLWAVYDLAAKGGDIEKLRLLLDWGKRDPLFANSYEIPGRGRGPTASMSMLPAPNAFPLEAGFGLNSRNERGFTPLMEAAQAMQVPAVSLLLEHGADINVVSGPGGYSALDLVLARARADVKESGSEGFEIQLLRFIDLMLAVKPAPTIHPRYYSELAKSSDWKLTPHLAQFWKQVQERVIMLTPRDKVALTCPIEQVVRSSLDLASDTKGAR